MSTWKWLLVAQLWLVSSSFGENPGFISIDCGSDEDYVDNKTWIFYKSDRHFISTGEIGHIKQDTFDFPPFSSGKQFQTLRYFAKGRRNCYALQPKQGKNHNYLIRTLFKYGNYDEANQIPRFDLYLGANYWATIQPQSPSTVELREIINFSLTDTIHVCLVDSGFGTPFISALELRVLDDSIYRIQSKSLLYSGRYDYGNTTMTPWGVRYKDDAYDRIWIASTPNPTYSSINTTSDIDVSGSNNYFKLPVEIMRSALWPPRPLRSLNLTLPRVPKQEFFLCFHFTELEKIAEGEKREFIINSNGVNYGPIRPQYLKPLNICTQTSSNNEGRIPLFIKATPTSDLPPIINALEVYRLGMLLNSSTDSADVDAIMEIMQTYSINKDDGWQGDPCMPRGFVWTGLKCSYDSDPPRITSLNLSSSKLRGNISLAFSKLKAIQSLDLSFNELIGEVPEFLAQLQNLTVLNLASNRLTGAIPQSLLQKSSNGLLSVSFNGNLNLCQTDSCVIKKTMTKEKSFPLPVVILLAIVSMLLLFNCLVVMFCIMQRRRRADYQEGSVVLRNRSFSYAEIVEITDNFKTIIGEGGFGKVYFGTLKDCTTQVAVKLLSQYSRQGYKEFQAEAQLLMTVHHRNLVSLIGYCDDTLNKALVYEYLACGNLKEHLSEASGIILNWEERLRIAVDAAHGVEYLHNGCKPPIIHRDLKTSNILLNEKLQAKVADLGLSRAFANESGSHVTTRPAGTYGYLDPQAQTSGNFSKKSDVYSFGTILLEIITGQPAIRRDGNGNVVQIQHWARSRIERGDIESIVDYRLNGHFDRNSAWKLVEMALTCALNNSVERPDMSCVLAEVNECLGMVMSSKSQSNSLEMMSLAEVDSVTNPSPR